MPEEIPQEEKNPETVHNETPEEAEEAPPGSEETEKVGEAFGEAVMETGGSFSIFEWMIFFFIALIGDILDILLHLGTVTIPVAWAIDVVMLGVVGGWAYLRTGEVPEKGEEILEKGEMLKPSRWKAFPKKRLALVFGGELVPWFGAFLFGWTIFMLSLLKKYK